MYQVSWPISWFVKQVLDAVCSVCFPDRSYCFGIPIDNLSLDFYCFTFQRWVKWAARTEKKREKENEKETQDIWGWVLRGNWTVIDILADFLPKKVSLTLISQRRLSFLVKKSHTNLCISMLKAQRFSWGQKIEEMKSHLRQTPQEYPTRMFSELQLLMHKMPSSVWRFIGKKSILYSLVSVCAFWKI